MELILIVKTRNKNDCQKMSKKRLQDLITMPTPRPTPTSKHTPKPRPASRQVPTSRNIGEFERTEMTKNRPLVFNAFHDWYGWSINHIREPIKRSASNVKEKIIRLFQAISKSIT